MALAIPFDGGGFAQERWQSHNVAVKAKQQVCERVHMGHRLHPTIPIFGGMFRQCELERA